MTESVVHRLPLFTVEMSLCEAHYKPQMPCVAQAVVDVFANSRDEAIEMARMTLRDPDQYAIDGVTEN